MKKSPKKVLVVDDEKEVCEFLKEYLEELGYEVVTAFCGRTAIEATKKMVPDLILLDVQMPEMDGLEALQQIKSDFPGMKVLMVTGVSDADTIEKVMRMGGNHYLMKPLKLEELKNQVKNLTSSQD